MMSRNVGSYITISLSLRLIRNVIKEHHFKGIGHPDIEEQSFILRSSHFVKTWSTVKSPDLSSRCSISQKLIPMTMYELAIENDVVRNPGLPIYKKNDRFHGGPVKN